MRGRLRREGTLTVGLVWCGSLRWSQRVRQPAIEQVVVTSMTSGSGHRASGAEAGVWVTPKRWISDEIREVVVTDDSGRYLLPDLPKANYNVWVRGYGLVDSPKVNTGPGKNLNLTAVKAPDPRAAAQYYPAGYWASLITVPEKSEFPGKGGNGIAPTMKSQAEWLAWMKNGSCYTCHQLGDKATREIPGAGVFPSSTDAWVAASRQGSRPRHGEGDGPVRDGAGCRHVRRRSDRIAAGEVPPAPPRPQGVERNVVITQ